MPEVAMQRGDRSDMHSHPDAVVHLLSSGAVKSTTTSGDTVEVELPTGATRWREAEEHSTDNEGGTIIHGLIPEPK